MIYWRQFAEAKQSACSIIQECHNGEPAPRTDQIVRLTLKMRTCQKIQQINSGF